MQQVVFTHLGFGNSSEVTRLVIISTRISKLLGNREIFKQRISVCSKAGLVLDVKYP